MTSPSTPAVRRVRRRSRRRRSSPWERPVILAVAGAAAIGGALAPVEPVGLVAVDRLLAAGLAALITLAASRARRWTWIWLAGIVTAAAIGSLAAVPGALALAGCAMAIVERRHRRVTGAVIGALAVQSLLRIDPIELSGSAPFGLPSLVAVIGAAPVLWSAWRRSGPGPRRATAWVLGAAGVLVVVAGLGLAAAALGARHHVTVGVDEAKAGLDALRGGEQEAAAGHFERAAGEFDRARSATDAPWALPARVVPVLAQQADALATVTEAGRDLTTTAGEAATAAPYQQLRARAGQIDLAAVTSMQEPVAASADALERAHDDVEGVQSPWLLGPLADPVDRFLEEIDRARPEATLADDALQVAPGLLGADGPRRYFIAFSTPAEMRFQGGFIGAYGILTADQGKVTLERTGSVGELSGAPGAAGRALSGPALYLERYGRFQPARYLQNLTASPDLPDNAAALADLVPQAGGPELDGVIYVDPVGLAALLELTGPVTVEGLAEPLDAEHAADYLLRDQYETDGPQSEREDRLTAASRATFDALVARDLPSPQEIGAVLGPAMHEGRLLFTSFDPVEQDFLRELGATGGFLAGVDDAGPAVPGGDGSDWFSVRTSNSGGSKIDSFLRREVTYEVRYDPASGAFESTATVVLHNDAPTRGLPEYVIGNLYGDPLGTSRIYLGFFTAGQLRDAALDGAPLPVEAQREFGGNVYSSRLDLPPGGTATLVLRLHGTGHTGNRAGGPYRLAVGHQPLANDDRLVVRVSPVDGATVAEASADGPDGAPGVTVVDGVAVLETEQHTDLSLQVRMRH